MQGKVLTFFLCVICVAINACGENKILVLTATSTLTEISISPTQTATKTITPTVTVVPITKILATTLDYIPVFPPESPGEGRVCGQYSPVPQQQPSNFQPVAYLRVFALDENLWLEPVAVELGLFVKPIELNEIGGKIVYSYTEWTEFMVHSAIYLQDAPVKVQETLKSGALIGSIEIVDLQNNTLPYLISDESLKDITYVVDDLMPHPVLDMVVPCSGFIDGHAISYASIKLQAP